MFRFFSSSLDDPWGAFSVPQFWTSFGAGGRRRAGAHSRRSVVLSPRLMFPPRSGLGRLCFRHSPFAPNCKGDMPLYGFARCARPFVGPSGLPESRPGRQAIPAPSRPASIPRGTFARELPFGEAFRQILRHTSTSLVSFGMARGSTRHLSSIGFLFSLHT